MAAKIRRDDEIIVLTGKDKGKRGKVKQVLSSGKVIVEGINLVKNIKAGSGPNQPKVASLKKLQFRFLTLQSSMRQPSKADRVGFRFEDGKKSVSSNPTKKLSEVILEYTMAKLHDYYKDEVVKQLMSPV